MTFDLQSLCTPAKIYFILAIVYFIFAVVKRVHFMTSVINLLFAFAWTYLLSWLCKKGWSKLSWAILLFPYILIMLVAFRVVSM